MKRLFGLLSAKKEIRLGLALGGGGARGLAHIAFLKALDEAGVRPAVISGSSLGALIGALYASGRSGREIERIFREQNLLSVVSLADVSLWHASSGLLRGEKIFQLLSQLTGRRHFHQLDIPLRVMATDFWSQSEVVLKEGEVAEAVRASISLPGIFEPVLRDHRVLIDGGIANSLPYEVIRPECDVLAAVNVVGERVRTSGPLEKPRIFEAIFAAFQMVEGANIEYKLKQSKPDIYVKPRLQNIQILDFHRLPEILDAVKPEVKEFRRMLVRRALCGAD